MERDQADCGAMTPLLNELGAYLDEYLKFNRVDAVENRQDWESQLQREMPDEGVGIHAVMAELGNVVIPNSSQIPHPGCTSFITTGATNIGAITTLASAVASPQRFTITAFNFLEELSLQWMVSLFQLSSEMKGIYSSGGSVANLIGLGAARQFAFEKLGVDPAEYGVNKPCRIYATEATHHAINRSAAALGMGRKSVSVVESDLVGRMNVNALIAQIETDLSDDVVPVAIVANAGTTSTGVVDPISALSKISKQYGIWFHVDGAYGLPGILDPKKNHLFKGIESADSVVVDPHKWLGAPVGIGATFVRDRNLLYRAFNQGSSDYLEGSLREDAIDHSLDSLGIPYSDFGVELSAPSRGSVVWGLLREIGRQGLQERVCRHNAMAEKLAALVSAHPDLELLQDPVLSICCFRVKPDQVVDLNHFNKLVHRRLVHRGKSMPSTAVIHNKLAIRPCFIGARTTWRHVDELVEEVLLASEEVLAEWETENITLDQQPAYE